MKHLDGGLENVKGFSYSSIKCGIRYADRLDYSLILSDTMCNAAGVFTTNRMTAAPVKLCRERINGSIRGILVNATNANACTGAEGFTNSKILTADVAKRLNLAEESILMASTGIIGRQLPLDKMLESHGKLITNLSGENGPLLAQAIMTTDTVPKQAAVSFTCGGREYRIAGTAKGSGMIAPRMATLLAFLVTDAPVDRENLEKIFRAAVNKTLNSITIDGDTSTNDTAIILSPDTGKYIQDADSLSAFTEALEAVLMKLAEMLVQDGEGATKSVKIHVINAATDDDAMLIARAVGQSLLVKTAFFGNDPNWGRIACAAGYSGAALEEENLSISIENIPLLVNGIPAEADYSQLEKVLKNRNYTVTVDMGLGSGDAIMLTTDISYDYVKINAQYST
ncbi:MAG TPA: bifunctional glutamate N-acetyltransferase/amino-acid acetyltransferase ArgJ [Spirochaetota bacterium]|nr:bifunctional glutamate N-acetyltransferase/amino-acid acetyltransferase ArgJ [Spirochaetota bacterium]